MRTKVAVLEVCFENVLSKTSAYIAPLFAGTSYVPVETLSASHFPCHETNMSPMLLSFSIAADDELPRLGKSLGASLGRMPGVGGASNVEVAEVLGVMERLVPGCLKRPKLIDFLCGWTLQDIVCSPLTCTHLTRYD